MDPNLAKCPRPTVPVLAEGHWVSIKHTQITAMAILKQVLCNPPAFEMMTICNDIWQIVVGVDMNFEVLGAMLQQEMNISICTSVDFVGNFGIWPRWDLIQQIMTAMNWWKHSGNVTTIYIASDSSYKQTLTKECINWTFLRTNCMEPLWPTG